MAKFVFLHGDPLMVDYTPSGADVAAGDVVIFAGKACIAHTDIPDGKLGALAWPNGRAVYEIGEELDWDNDGEEPPAYYDSLSAGGILCVASGLFNSGVGGDVVGVVATAISNGHTTSNEVGVRIIHGG